MLKWAYPPLSESEKPLGAIHMVQTGTVYDGNRYPNRIHVQHTLIKSYQIERQSVVKGVLHPWALFLKTLCIFPKNKATLDKVSYGSGQKCSKELQKHSFISVEAIVVKLQ